jgi:hypothetical protein
MRLHAGTRRTSMFNTVKCLIYVCFSVAFHCCLPVKEYCSIFLSFKRREAIQSCVSRIMLHSIQKMFSLQVFSEKGIVTR